MALIITPLYFGLNKRSVIFPLKLQLGGSILTVICQSFESDVDDFLHCLHNTRQKLQNLIAWACLGMHRWFLLAQEPPLELLGSLFKACRFLQPITSTFLNSRFSIFGIMQILTVVIWHKYLYKLLNLPIMQYSLIWTGTMTALRNFNHSKAITWPCDLLFAEVGDLVSTFCEALGTSSTYRCLVLTTVKQIPSWIKSRSGASRRVWNLWL